MTALAVTAERLSKATGRTKRSVSGALFRLSRDGKVVRVGRGIWKVT